MEAQIPHPTISSRTCECCKERPGTLRSTFLPGATKPLQAYLCQSCKDAGHLPGKCMGCNQLVWVCAQMNHAATQHPELLEKMTNYDKDPENAPPEPAIKKIGSLPHNWPEILEREGIDLG